MAAGTLAGDGRLNVGVVLATAMCGWLLGSVARQSRESEMV
jgi:hypothetical protein